MLTLHEPREEEKETGKASPLAADDIDDGLSGGGDVSRLPSAMDEYAFPRGWADTPLREPEPEPDLLKLKYPAFAPNIDKARTLGLEDGYIEERLGLEEGKALFYLTPQEIGRRLGRTPETREAVTRHELARRVTAYETARRLELPREEIEDRIRAAGYLGVSESLLIKDDEIWKRLQKEYRLRESYFETVRNSLERERLNAEAAKIGAAVLYSGVATEEGRKRLEEIGKRQAGIAPAPLSGQLQKAVGGSSEFLAQQFWNLHAGLPYATAAILTTAAAGNAGPQALAPEEAVTLPAAAAVGFAFGSTMNMFELEAGLALNEFLTMKDENGQPMDLDAARAAAVIVGAVNAGIETLQLETLVGSFPGGKKLLSSLSANTMKKALQIPSVRAALGKAAKDYLGNITKETAQEVSQELTTVLGGELAKLIAGVAGDRKFAGLDMNRTLDRLLDTAIETARSMALTMAPGAGVSSFTGARDAGAVQRAESDAKRAAGEAEKIMNEGEKTEPERVFVPRAAIESYAQENPGKLEEAGIDPAAGTEDEVMMTPEQYEALNEKAPELAEAVKNDARRSAKGATPNEAARKAAEFVENAEDAARNAAEIEESRRVAEHAAKMAQGAGFDKDLSRSFGRVVASAARQLAKATRRAMTEFTSFGMIKTEYEKWKANQEKRKSRTETFEQPVNADVDLDAEVDVVDIELGQHINAQLSTPEDLLRHIKGFVGKGIALSADSKAILELSSNSNAKHLVSSSKKGLTYEEVDARASALNSVDDIVKNAVLIETYPNKDPKDRHLLNVHRLYVPMRIGNTMHVLRLVGNELKEKGGFKPVKAELFDLIIEKKNSTTQPQSGTALSGGSPAPAEGGTKLTIREMIRGVNDAQGNPYVLEQSEALYQGEKAPNAVTQLMGEFVSMMSFFEGANASTPFHEFMHHVLNIYDRLADMDGVEDWIKQDFDTVLKEFGYTKEQFRSDKDIARDVHERFARGFEVYAATGEAPSKALRGVFENLRKWLVQVYGDVKATLGVELSDSLREVYDRLLAAPEEIDAEYKRRTTVADIAAETAAVNEAIERAEAEERAEQESKKAGADPDAMVRPEKGWTHVGREKRAERVLQIKSLTPAEITPAAPMDKKGMEAAAEGFGEFENNSDKRKVTVPKNAIGKIFNHKGFDTSTIVGSLKSLFETSIPVWSEGEILKKGHKAHSNFKGYHHYVNKFTDGKDEYFIRFSVSERKGKQGKSGSSEIHSAAISDISIYRNDGGSQSVRVIDPVLRNAPSFRDKRLQEFFDSVNLRSAKEKLAALREKARVLQEEKRGMNKALKAINRMADDGRVIWGVQREIQKKLAGYDLKKRSKGVLDRRAELEAYLAANPEAGDTMSPADLKYLGTRTIGGGLGQMTLADVETLRDEVTEMYERGKREFAAWDAARQERIDRKNRALIEALRKIKPNLPTLITGPEDLKKQYEGVRGRLEQAKDWVYSNTLGAQRFFDWLDGGGIPATGNPSGVKPIVRPDLQ